jgi:hypothetical protein
VWSNIGLFIYIYQNQFIEKNNDALHASLQFLIQDSNDALLKKMFEGTQVSTGKLNFISVGSKFRQQLVILMEKLKTTVRTEFNLESKFLLKLIWSLLLSSVLKHIFIVKYIQWNTSFTIYMKFSPLFI